MDDVQNQPTQPVGEPPVSSTDNKADSRQSWLPRLFWQGRIGPAFWTVASLLSLSINVVLIVGLVMLGKQLFALKSLLSDQLIGGLYQNFVLMDHARIQSSVQVNDRIAVQFDLPVDTTTTVRLTENTRIRGATVSLATGGLVINNAPTNIILPAGTELPIKLSIVVPVDTSVPVQLNVPVDIPMSQTELHQPFVGLQNVLAPYQRMLDNLPDAWQDIPLCSSSYGWVCQPVLGDAP